MPQFKCYPRSDPNANFLYCPSYAAAILFATLYGAVVVSHTLQAILYKKPFAAVLIMGAAWEFAGYIFRILAVQNQLADGVATAQQLLILLAPLWINAFVYMVLGRMLHFYLEDDRVFRIKARRITLIFVLFDISAFVVQATGGLMTTPGSSTSTQKLGVHIYMGGVGLQLFFICIFIALAVRFQQKLFQQQCFDVKNSTAFSSMNEKSPVRARRLLYVVYAVLILIIFRNIYREVEFSSGVISNITTHEWYTYGFDAVPMFFALVIFNFFHPARFLRGERCDFSEENRQLKAAKREKRLIKGQEKDTAKQEKLRARVMKQQEKAAKKNSKERKSMDEV